MGDSFLYYTENPTQKGFRFSIQKQFLHRPNAQLILKGILYPAFARFAIISLLLLLQNNSQSCKFTTQCFQDSSIKLNGLKIEDSKLKNRSYNVLGCSLDSSVLNFEAILLKYTIVRACRGLRSLIPTLLIKSSQKNNLVFCNIDDARVVDINDQIDNSVLIILNENSHT